VLEANVLGQELPRVRNRPDAEGDLELQLTHLSPEGIPISGLGDVDVDGASQEQALDLDRVLLSVLVYAAQAHSDGGRVVALR